MSATKPGIVYLVGAGPSDPGLVTARAVECLRRADMVLVDYLVDPAVLDHAPAGAERVSLGHHRTGREMTPEEVAERMIDGARRGRTVVRLKGGDPSVFARGGDEVGALRAAGIPFEIVPGVTSGLVAARSAGMLDGCPAIALATGRQRSYKGCGGLDYAKLAGFPGVLLFYMGVRTSPEWSESLIAYGRPPDTPAAIVRCCTGPEERMVRCTLSEVPDTIQTHKMRPPAIIAVGPVARSTTISAHYDYIERLQQYDWLVLGDSGDVTRFLAHLRCQGGDARQLAGVRVAVFGRASARRLEHVRIRPELVAEERASEVVPEQLLRACRGRRVLLVHTGSRATGVNEALAAIADHLETLT